MAMRDTAVHPLKAWRTAKRLSLRRLAEQLGLTYQAVARIEKGFRPSIDTAQKIERITDGAVKATWLLFESKKGP